MSDGQSSRTRSRWAWVAGFVVVLLVGYRWGLFGWMYQFLTRDYPEASVILGIVLLLWLVGSMVWKVVGPILRRLGEYFRLD